MRAVAVVVATVVWLLGPEVAGERAEERALMVQRQIEHPTDGRVAVSDKAVLAAMKTVPRHVFVPEADRRRAYRDSPLPIGHGQTISQPYMVAIMTELLDLDRTKRVLEIGTGSGYQAAVLAQLTPHVYTIEIVEPLAQRAQSALKAQGRDDVNYRTGDGYHGWPEHAPFDVIIVTCASGHLPPPLWEQLAPGGRIVIPIGGVYEVQRLVVLTKQPDGTRRSRTVMPVRFVPMTGEAER
jgi:protein-L-isoaspartate(D-aspartate) O-methyltransferase